MPTSTDAPLSSLDMVPMTEETHDRLKAVGIDPTTIGPPLSELGARSLLMLHEDDDVEEGGPDCYRVGYDPRSMLCGGCVFQPSCWRVSPPYLAELAEGKADPPPGVPDHVVRARVEYAQAHPVPEPPGGWASPACLGGLADENRKPPAPTNTYITPPPPPPPPKRVKNLKKRRTVPPPPPPPIK